MVVVPLSLEFQVRSVTCAYSASNYRESMMHLRNLQARLVSTDKSFRIHAGAQVLVDFEVEFYTCCQYTRPEDLQLGLSPKDLGGILYVEESPRPRVTASMIWLEDLAAALLCHREHALLRLDSSNEVVPRPGKSSSDKITLLPRQTFPFRGVSVHVGL